MTFMPWAPALVALAGFNQAATEPSGPAVGSRRPGAGGQRSGGVLLFQKIAESRILEAIQDGVFDNLAGKGQPLSLNDDRDIPPELRLAYKILKMADCLPPELHLQKEIVTLQEMLANLPDEAAKLQQLRRLNFLTMKLNMMRRVSPLLQEHSEYQLKILNKLDRLPQPQK